MRYAFLLAVFVMGCGGAGFKIATKNLPNAYLGEPYIAELKMDGVAEDEEDDLKWSYEGTLPEGLELSEHGFISGTPSEQGDFSFVVRVENEKSGDRAKRRFTLTVVGIQITTPTSDTIDMVYNVAQYISFDAEHGKEPLSWEISDGTLPNGVSLASSGLLYGTPEEEGDFPVVVKVTDSSSNTDERAYVIRVAKASGTLTITALPTSPDNDGQVGLPYEFQFEATPAGQHYWLANSSELPPGLTLEEESGRLYGTPETPGTFTFSVEVYDQATGANGKSTVSITILPMEIPVTQPQITDGTVGAVYNAKLTTDGGFAPIKWSLTGAGDLPPGLQLYDDGTITGVPTQLGEFHFGVQAEDDRGNVARATLSINISSGAPLAILTQSSDIPQAQVGVDFGSFQFTATNYKGSLLWNCEEPPEGFHLSQDGVLTGVPQEEGSYVFKVEVTDQGTGDTAEKYFTIQINGLGDIGVSVSSGNISGDTITVSAGSGVYITFTVSSGGIPPINWNADAPTIDGMDFSSQGYFYGTPTTPGEYAVVVTATDTAGNTRSKAFIIKVQ